MMMMEGQQNGTAAMDLNSCREGIGRAASTKIERGASISIRQCLLEAGFDDCQASHRTMQARVRREVQRLSCGGGGDRNNQSKTAVKRRRANSKFPPVEISFAAFTRHTKADNSHGRHPSITNDYDDTVEDYEEVELDDGVSVLTNASSLVEQPSRNHHALQALAATTTAVANKSTVAPPFTTAAETAYSTLMLPTAPALISECNSFPVSLIHRGRTSFSPDLSDLQSRSLLLSSLDQKNSSPAASIVAAAAAAAAVAASKPSTLIIPTPSTAASSPLQSSCLHDLLSDSIHQQKQRILESLSNDFLQTTRPHDPLHDIIRRPFLLNPFVATTTP